MRLLKTTVLCIALLPAIFLSADDSCIPDSYTPSECCLPPYCNELYQSANRLTIGPEIYYLQRSRRGGTRQQGPIFGVRATYDHIKRYHIYLGAQALYAAGTLHGHSGSKAKIRSHWTDEQIEGTVGYTFEMKEYPKLSFTPFGGYGYFREINKFISPSPLHLNFVTSFGYFSYGFLSSILVTPDFNFGINLRLRTPWQPRCRISHDPDHPNNSPLIGDSILYRLEFPMIYCRYLFCTPLKVELTPFYESRLYGGRENFPFDFFKTRIHIFGATLSLMYQF